MGEDKQPVWSGLFGRWLDHQTVPVSGFAWVPGVQLDFTGPSRGLDGTPTAGGPWLVPVDGSMPATQPVDVLNDPRRTGFHRTFARLADGGDAKRQDRVLRFASRYGFLDGDQLTSLYRHLAPPEQTYIDGESWDRWELAIFLAAAVVKLWDLVRTRQTRDLVRLVSWDAAPYVTLQCLYRRGNLYRSPNDWAPDAWEEWRGGAGFIQHTVRLPEFAGKSLDESPTIALEAARQVIYQEVARHLNGKVAPLLSRRTSPDLIFRPRTLLAAVYLHLAREISDRHRQLIECANPQCRTSFEPQHGRQQYCEARCRKQADYHRHALQRRGRAKP